MGAQEAPPQRTAAQVTVRPLRAEDIPAADRIFRVAFGTFLGVPDPPSFMGDAGYIRTRWLADPASAFAAEVSGQLVGSNLATQWGSVGFFGPLTVEPRFWDSGIGSRLMEPIVGLFDQWKVTHAGLFTFPHSVKHLGLYQKFGFWPRFLTSVSSKQVAPARKAAYAMFSKATPERRAELINDCRELTHAIYDGLDLEHEIHAVETHKLGDTLLVEEDSKVAALAVCHCGSGTEAGSGTCYIKFGAARPGPKVAESFERLLDACEAFAADRGLMRLVAGVSTARQDACRRMMARGFRADLVGVAMMRNNEPGYSRPDVYAIDDWR